jgi:peptidyl-prolyl cis-trans isomerase C
MRLCFQEVSRIFVAALVVCLCSIPVWAQKPAPADQMAASVNGKPISKSLYDQQLSIFQKQTAQQGRPLTDEQLARASKEILEGLIVFELLYQQSQKVGIKVKEQSIDEQVDSINTRKRNEAEFKKAMDEMKLSDEEIREQIHRRLAVNQLIDTEVREKIKVSNEESKKFYQDNPNMFKQPEQVRASHILIKVGPEADESAKTQARKKIEAVQKKVGEGKDFGSLAKAESEGPSAKREGDLGFFSRGQMVKPFEDAAFALKVGQVSPIVETQFGYHLIKVTDKKPPRTIDYAEVQLRLEQHLKKEKEQTAIRAYIDDLKKSATIKRFI